MNLTDFLKNTNKIDIPILENGKSSDIEQLFNNLIKNTLPNYKTVIKWNELLLNYIEKDDAIFFIRRYASAKEKKWNLIRRGFLTEYSSGLKYVFCDNYFAHYFYSMAINNFIPSLTEFHSIIKSRKFPYGFQRTSSEEKFQAFPKGNSTKINKSGWKLAHIYSVNKNDYNFNYRKESNKLFPRGEQDDWKIQNGNDYPSRIIKENHSDFLKKITIAHFLRLVHPINFFLVPGKKSSNIDIGENSHLISLIREHNKTTYGELFQKYEEIIQAKFIEPKEVKENKIDFIYGLNINPKKENSIKFKTENNINYSKQDLSIIKAYLIDSKSYRAIEKDILKIKSPTRGGGFNAKKILNEYGIEGKHKGILVNKNIDEIILTVDDNLKTTLIKLKDFLKNQ